jgi:hypothetical protein
MTELKGKVTAYPGKKGGMDNKKRTMRWRQLWSYRSTERMWRHTNVNTHTSGGVAPLIFILGTGWRYLVSVTPQLHDPLQMYCSSQQNRRRVGPSAGLGILLLLLGTENINHPAHSLVTIVTEISCSLVTIVTEISYSLVNIPTDIFHSLVTILTKEGKM